MEQNVDILGGGGVQGFLTRQSSAALSEQVPVSAVHAATAPLVEFMASAPAVHAAPALVGLLVSSWRLLPQFTLDLHLTLSTLRLVLLVMMLHVSSRTLIWTGWIFWAEWFTTRGPA